MLIRQSTFGLTLFWLLEYCACWETYEGYKFADVVPQNQDHIRVLRSLHSTGNYDFVRVSRSIDQKTTLFLHPDQVDKTAQIFNDANVQFTLREASFDPPRRRRFIHSYNESRKGYTDSFSLEAYNDFDDQMRFISSVANSHRDFVTLSSLGRSYDGRNIQYLKIGYPTNGAAKPTFFIDAGIHAREWISPASALWIINELTQSNEYRDLLTKMDFIIAPNLNPDGYQYSRKQYRMWRKNTSPQRYNCMGVDLNRNFPYKFGYAGTSADPCSEIFKGSRPASEPEAALLKSFLDNNKAHIKAYITIHSFGENWVYPWGWAYRAYPDDVQDLIDLANEARKAIASVRGTQYMVSSSADGMYPAAGASDDYAKSIGIKYVYTVELSPNREDTRYEFSPPESMIVPTSKEILQGLLVVARKVAEMQ